MATNEDEEFATYLDAYLRRNPEQYDALQKVLDEHRPPRIHQRKKLVPTEEEQVFVDALFDWLDGVRTRYKALSGYVVVWYAKTHAEEGAPAICQLIKDKVDHATIVQIDDALKVGWVEEPRVRKGAYKARKEFKKWCQDRYGSRFQKQLRNVFPPSVFDVPPLGDRPWHVRHEPHISTISQSILVLLAFVAPSAAAPSARSRHAVPADTGGGAADASNARVIDEGLAAGAPGNESNDCEQRAPFEMRRCLTQSADTIRTTNPAGAIELYRRAADIEYQATDVPAAELAQANRLLPVQYARPQVHAFVLSPVSSTSFLTTQGDTPQDASGAYWALETRAILNRLAFLQWKSGALTEAVMTLQNRMSVPVPLQLAGYQLYEDCAVLMGLHLVREDPDNAAAMLDQCPAARNDGTRNGQMTFLRARVMEEIGDYAGALMEYVQLPHVDGLMLFDWGNLYGAHADPWSTNWKSIIPTLSSSADEYLRRFDDTLKRARSAKQAVGDRCAVIVLSNLKNGSRSVLLTIDLWSIYTGTCSIDGMSIDPTELDLVSVKPPNPSTTSQGRYFVVEVNNTSTSVRLTIEGTLSLDRVYRNGVRRHSMRIHSDLCIWNDELRDGSACDEKEP